MSQYQAIPAFVSSKANIIDLATSNFNASILTTSNLNILDVNNANILPISIKRDDGTNVLNLTGQKLTLGYNMRDEDCIYAISSRRNAVLELRGDGQNAPAEYGSAIVFYSDQNTQNSQIYAGVDASGNGLAPYSSIASSVVGNYISNGLTMRSSTGLNLVVGNNNIISITNTFARLSTSRTLNLDGNARLKLTTYANSFSFNNQISATVSKTGVTNGTTTTNFVPTHNNALFNGGGATAVLQLKGVYQVFFRITNTTDSGSVGVDYSYKVSVTNTGGTVIYDNNVPVRYNSSSHSFIYSPSASDILQLKITNNNPTTLDFTLAKMEVVMLYELE